MGRSKQASDQHQDPKPKNVLTIPMKSLNKCYLLAVFAGLILMHCAAQPRYTSQPVERKSRSPLEERAERNKETLPSFPTSQGKIDQVKMSKIIQSYLGTPYKEGGTSSKGMDCSGLVIRLYKEYAGSDLPHNSKELYKLATKVDKGELRYGDLVFFANSGFLPSHVGIYVGEGKFVHSTKEYGVIVSSLEEERYRKSYIGAGRVIP